MSYRLDLTQPESGEIAVVMDIANTLQPLVLELPDSYGNGLAVGLSSHIMGEKALDESGRELPVNRDGDTWTIDYNGNVTFSYKVKISAYETGTAYLDSLARAGNPWPFFPSLDTESAYLPGYALFVRPSQLQGIVPRLELELPSGWQPVLPWPEQPAGMDELLNNPVVAGNLALFEQGPLLIAVPASSSAASGSSLEEYANKAQSLLEKAESLMGGLDLSEGEKLPLIMLFSGEGDPAGTTYYPSAPFSGTVVLSGSSGTDPLSDTNIEATARGMTSLLLAKEIETASEAAWFLQGCAWYLQDFLPYDAGLWGTSLFWDLFNGHYNTYLEARGRCEESMSQAGSLGYEAEDASIILTCGGASACAVFDSELRSQQPDNLDLASFLREISGVYADDEPLSNEDIRGVLETLTGRDWSAFFRDYIDGVLPVPASYFSSLNIVEPESTDIPVESPEGTTSTSGWVLMVVAVLLVFIIPFLFEPYTMRPRKPGFLQKKLEKDE